MEIISIEGIVVGTTKYGENSKILNILTKDKGLIGVISKGSLKEKSKLPIYNWFTKASLTYIFLFGNVLNNFYFFTCIFMFCICVFAASIALSNEIL